MLTILHLISGDIWAGAEAMFCHLIKGLQRFDDIETQVILSNEGRLSEEIRRLGIKVNVVDELTTSFVRSLHIIKDISRTVKPHIIHSHGYKQNILSYLISRSINPVKLLGTQHGMPRVDRKASGLKHRLIFRCNLILLSKYFHKIVGVSEEVREMFVGKYRFGEDKVSVIHNGIEVPRLPKARGNNDYFVIGSSGRLFPVKDYAFMVEIAKAVRKKTDRIRFQLAGDGPERLRLKELTSRYHLDDVFTFKGHLEDLSLFYQGLDLYLNTSMHEGIPMSVLEAMSHKLPIIAPKVGGFPEIIDDGVQGYLLENRNPEAFAEKCLFLYGNKSLRQEMSKAAREKVEEKFSADRMARNYFNLYVDLVHGGESTLSGLRQTSKGT